MGGVWALFGARLWHDDDLHHLDVDTFEAMKRAVDQAEKESSG